MPWKAWKGGAHFSAIVKGFTALEMSAQCSNSAIRNCRSSGVFHTSGMGCAPAPALASRPSPMPLAEGLLSSLMLALMDAEFNSWKTFQLHKKRYVKCSHHL